MTSRHVSQANWRKIIEDFRSGYQLRTPWEIVLIELIANSIDAGATEIRLDIEGECPKILRVADNGRGMSHGEFAQYHNLGSLTKRRGAGIGWAGIGAKLYLDRCGSIYTETRSNSFEGASKWFLPRGPKAPVWEDVPSRHLLRGRRGTVVEILVTDRRECSRISPPDGSSTILSHFNYALHPHGPLSLRLNGIHITPFDPGRSAQTAAELKVKLRDGSTAEARFFLLREDVPEGFNLVSIVVHSKTIGDNYDFHQIARIKEPARISGSVRCDSLVRVITTSKDNFNRKTTLWRDFDRKVGTAFSEWLRDVGQLESPSIGKERQALANRVQKDLNKIFELPEIRNLQLDPFQSTTRQRVPVPDPTSELAGKEVLGQQLVPGTFGGEETGQRVSVVGDEPGTSVLSDETGRIKVTEHERLLRSGTEIRILPFPTKTEPAWMDLAEQAIIVNESHPAFCCAEATGAAQFYVIETCFRILADQVEDEGERQAVLSRLFLAYVMVNVQPGSAGAEVQ